MDPWAVTVVGEAGQGYYGSVAALREEPVKFVQGRPEGRAGEPALGILRTTIRSRPPSDISTSTRVTPASKAFSESSLTTEAGRSTTSPAATCWATRGSSTATLPKEKDLRKNRLQE